MNRIVAVHGLGAHPVHTWEGKPSTGSLSKLHLLRDLLREDFPTARISSFAYNSDWLVDAPEKTAQQIGRRLLEKLSQHRGDSQRLPIIFIGHSFGGIVIKEVSASYHIMLFLTQRLYHRLFVRQTRRQIYSKIRAASSSSVLLIKDHHYQPQQLY